MHILARCVLGARVVQEHRLAADATRTLEAEYRVATNRAGALRLWHLVAHTQEYTLVKQPQGMTQQAGLVWLEECSCRIR